MNTEKLKETNNEIPTTETTSTASKREVNRCDMCNRKVGLLGFKCKCQLMFCSAHRAAEIHSCSFDCRKTQREHLIKMNPVICAPKLV